MESRRRHARRRSGGRAQPQPREGAGEARRHVQEASHLVTDGELRERDGDALFGSECRAAKD